MPKQIDLSSRANLPHNHQAVPSFTPVNHFPGQLVFAAAATRDLFALSTAVTIRRVIIQLSAATTIQLLINGEPASPALTLPVNAVISFPGLFLPNNAKLQILSTAAVTLAYDVVYLIGVHSEQIATDLHVSGLASSGGSVTVSNFPATQVVSGTVGINTTVNDNLIRQNGVPLSSPIADAPVGTETAPVVRPIARKQTTLETNVVLAGGATFTGAWHDSELDGTAFVVAWSWAQQVGSILAIDLSDDITNANFTKLSHAIIGTPTAGTLVRIGAWISARYWRVRYVNGATLQTSFELTSCSLPLGLTTGLANAGSDSGGFLQQIVLGLSQSSTFDNDVSSLFARWPLNNTQAAYIANPMLKYGGAFSGAANAALAGWSRARMPTVFKQVSSAATGSTAIWTPGTGNKFRLLGYRIQVTALAKAAAAADLVIKLLDSALDLGQAVMCTIQTTASASGGVFLDTGWVSLGEFGILSAAVNQVLNLNLSFALTGGLVNVTTQGTEE